MAQQESTRVAYSSSHVQYHHRHHVGIQQTILGLETFEQKEGNDYQIATLDAQCDSMSTRVGLLHSWNWKF
jgi:hypothetical protein